MNILFYQNIKTKNFTLFTHTQHNLIKENELSNSKYKGINYTSAIVNKNCIGTQFHPEKVEN